MSKRIFGYGSLLNADSLRATMPDVQEIKPCFVKGFVRRFSLWDPVGFAQTNADVQGIPFCALDAERVDDSSKHVNGVLFNVSDTNFENLLEREKEYALLETEAYDWETGTSLGTVFLFSANKNNGTYDFSNKAQQRYLEVCLEGAKAFGDRFFTTFLETTFIDDMPLTHVSNLYIE